MPLTHLYFIASAFFLALGAVLAKYLLSRSGAVIDPLPFLTLQLLGGVAFLSAVEMAKGWRRRPLRRLARPAAAGLVLGVGSLGTIMALASISASEASVIFAIQPVVIIALARVLLGERVTPAVFALSVVAVIGVASIVAGGLAPGATGRVAGIAFAVVSTVCAAVYVVWMRGLSEGTDIPSALVVVQVVAWFVAASAWGATELMDLTETRVGSSFLILSAAGTGVIYYGLAFYVYLIGLQKTEATTAGAYLNLVPVFAIGLASAILAEQLSSVQWVGALVVIGALTGISLLAPRPDQDSSNDE